MKKSISTFALFTLLAATSAVAQTQDNVSFAICGTTEGSIKQADLSNCSVLIPINKNLTIKSFTISILAPNVEVKKQGSFTDYSCTGSQISPSALEALKKASPANKILIEEIIASDGKADKKYPSFQIHIK